MDQSYNDHLAEQARLQHEQLAQMHQRQARDDAAAASGVTQPFAFRRHPGGDAPLDGPPGVPSPAGRRVALVIAVVFGSVFLVMFALVVSFIVRSWVEVSDGQPWQTEDGVWVETEDGTLWIPDEDLPAVP
ncbi:hypothetical protein [Demequina silvatica]|uniref:hypothetical protein n=1 Tax=Demequina silvatica TaxID=1638988 RepID=UPI00078268EC|nr:hypothetical protein [Demequina silvatica]